MKGWNTTTLDVISSGIQTGPFGSQLHQADYSEKGTPVVMPKDLVNGHISEDSIARVGNEHVSRLQRHLIQSGDILYSRRGDVGRCAYATQKEKGWLCGTGCLRVTIDPDIANPKFIFYQLQHPQSIGWVENHAIGSTMLNLNTSILGAVPIKLPSLAIQNQIADILSAYDDLIENNQKQIKLLEEAAQRLYKEWFVDLRFPGHETTPIIDGVPEGWCKGKISDFVLTSSGGTPSRTHAEYYSEGTNLWVKTHELNDGFIFDTEEKITDDAIKNSSAKIIPRGNILLAMYGATIGKIGIAATELTCNQACCVFHLSEVKYATSYLFCWLKDNREYFISQGKGAAQPNLSQATIKNFCILIPSSQVLTSFSQATDTMLEMVAKLQLQNRGLIEARNRLLPKLISGNLEA